MATNNAINVGTAASNTILQGQGAGVAPAFSTATYPSTTTINQILYSSAANSVAGITAANTGVLLSNGSGVPSWTTASTSFTPTITGSSTAGTATYSTQVGRYIQIGPLVCVVVNLTWTSGTGTGNLQISGLPVTVANASSPGGCEIGNTVTLPANTVTLQALANNASTNILIFATNSSGNATQVAYSAAGVVNAMVFYFAA